MTTRLALELIELLAVVLLVIPGLAFVLRIVAREPEAGWAAAIHERRLSLMVLALLAVVALNVSEDVFDADTRAVDMLALLSLRDAVGPGVLRFFELVTLTGSWMFLTPVTTIAVVALWCTHRRFEATLLATSGLGSALTIFLMKTLIGRERPSLWEVPAYWGSSFPSGHTLAVAAIAIAAAICTMHRWPHLKRLSLTIAMVWIFLVGASRLVLGVHWPTDVLVAACIGTALPILLSVLHALYRGDRTRPKPAGSKVARS